MKTHQLSSYLYTQATLSWQSCGDGLFSTVFVADVGLFDFWRLHFFRLVRLCAAWVSGVGVGGVAASVRFLAKPASRWLKGALCVLSLWPLFPVVPLFFLALEVVARWGQWPQVIVDDPKNLLGLSPRYDFWFHTTAYTEAFAGACLVSFFALLIANRARLSQRFRRTLFGMCAAAMVVSVLDPGQLFTWWMD